MSPILANASALHFQVTLTYAAALVRQAIRAFLWRSTGVQFVVALGLLIALFCWCVIRGDRSWLVGALGAALAIICCLALMVYVMHFRNTVGKFNAMVDPNALFAGTDSTFCIKSSLGETTMPWSSITEVWCFPNFWLLLFSRAQFITLPLEKLTVEHRAFITERIQKYGGKVTARRG